MSLSGKGSHPDVLMLVFGSKSPEFDNRVMKEARTLANAGWSVMILGIIHRYGAIPTVTTPEGIVITHITMPDEHYKERLRSPRRIISFLLGLLGILRYFVQIISTLWRVNPRVYHAHDFSALIYLGIGLLWGRKFVYDSHELWFAQSMPQTGAPFIFTYFFNLLRPLERWLSRRAQTVITVSESIAHHMQQIFAIEKPLIVYNAVDLRNLRDSDIHYRQPGERYLAHTGFAAIARNIDKLIESLVYLPSDFKLALIGLTSQVEELDSLATKLGVKDRILFIPPVPSEEVVSLLAQADLSISLVSSETLSFKYSMPNKVFEAMAAGVPMVCGNAVDTLQFVVNEYQFGISTDEKAGPQRIADDILRALEPETYQRLRANAIAARERVNWDTEAAKLIALYQRLLERPPR